MAIWPNTLSSFCKQQKEDFNIGEKECLSTILGSNFPSTHLTQNKLHITELTVLPQLTIVLMKSAFWVARELQEKFQKVHYYQSLHIDIATFF